MIRHLPCGLLLIGLPLVLSACALTHEEHLARDRRDCAGFGFRLDTQAYADCLLQRDKLMAPITRILISDAGRWGPVRLQCEPDARETSMTTSPGGPQRDAGSYLPAATLSTRRAPDGDSP